MPRQNIQSYEGFDDLQKKPFPKVSKTPTANAVPLADANGHIDSGWLEFISGGQLELRIDGGNATTQNYFGIIKITGVENSNDTIDGGTASDF